MYQHDSVSICTVENKKLDGKNIDRYSINWDGIFLEYDLEKIHSCKRKDIFETSEKLFFRRVSKDLVFCYDNQQFFALNTLVVVNLKKSTKISLKFLLGILNSKLMNYLYKGKFKSTKTVFSEIQARTVSQLPIPHSISSEMAKSIENLVEKILQIKNANPFTDTSALEAQIDQLVYQLYGLTAEEIAIIEGQNKA